MNDTIALGVEGPIVQRVSITLQRGNGLASFIQRYNYHPGGIQRAAEEAAQRWVAAVEAEELRHPEEAEEATKMSVLQLGREQLSQLVLEPARNIAGTWPHSLRVVNMVAIERNRLFGNRATYLAYPPYAA